MDDYENIFNGAGSAPTAAGGAASLGPDAAGYAPTAAATPTPRQTNPVDALAPQRTYQTEVLVPTDGRPIGPGDYIGDGTRANPFLKSSGDALSALVPPTTTGRNLTDGVFTRPVSSVANPAMPNASDSLARLRDSMLAAAYGRRVTREFLDALPEERKFKAMDRLVEALRKPTPGVEENLLDKWRNDDPNRFRGPYKPPSSDFRQKRPPEYDLPEFTLLRGSDGRERNGYDYNGVRVELPAGFDTSDPAKTAAQVSFSNQMVDWMTNDDDEMEV